MDIKFVKKNIQCSYFQMTVEVDSPKPHIYIKINNK